MSPHHLADFVKRFGYDPADLAGALHGGPVVERFPVHVPASFEPSDSDGDGPDRRWDRKLCPGQNPEDGYRPRWGGGFFAKRGEHLHAAIDIMTAEGVPVISPASLYVPREVYVGRELRPGAGTSKKGGNYFFLRDEHGWEWYGSHLRDEPSVKPGDEVDPGQLIGYVGRTGNAARTYGDGAIRGCPHLHLRLGLRRGPKSVRKYDARAAIEPLFEQWRGIAAVIPPKPVDGVIGCVRCGKPAALVDDVPPLDGLCPWCRADDAPVVTKAWLAEHCAS